MQSMTLGSWELTGNKVNAVTKKKSTHIKFTANPAHVQSQDSSITNNNSNVASQTLQHKNQSSSQSVPYAVNNVFNNNRPSTTASISLHSTKKQQMMRIASYQSNNSNNNSNSNINQRSSRNDRRRLQRYNERFDSDARSVLIGQPLAPPSVTSITSITSINSQTTLNQRSQESNDQSSINVPSSRSESSTSHASRSISRSRKRKRDDKSDKSKKDPIVFAVDPQYPNVPIVFRNAGNKSRNRERLNLDNRNLKVCPILKSEEKLRLLNYENNVITKIDNLYNVSNLIFLDFYNNKLCKIENLDNLPLLRVLMLGRNNINKIENLEKCNFLDVLDLHGNNIIQIENVSHLTQLRVLNLAGNQIKIAQNLGNLINIVELNLRRNYIEKIEPFKNHAKLQRVLLSNNQIKRNQDLVPLSFAPNIQQLSIENNPFVGQSSSILQSTLSSIITNENSNDQSNSTSNSNSGKLNNQDDANNVAAASNILLNIIQFFPNLKQLDMIDTAQFKTKFAHLVDRYYNGNSSIDHDHNNTKKLNDAQLFIPEKSSVQMGRRNKNSKSSSISNKSSKLSSLDLTFPNDNINIINNNDNNSIANEKIESSHSTSFNSDKKIQSENNTQQRLTLAESKQLEALRIKLMDLQLKHEATERQKSHRKLQKIQQPTELSVNDIAISPKRIICKIEKRWSASLTNKFNATDQSIEKKDELNSDLTINDIDDGINVASNFFQFFKPEKTLKLYGCGITSKIQNEIEKLYNCSASDGSSSGGSSSSSNSESNNGFQAFQIQQIDFYFVDFNTITKYFHYMKTSPFLQRLEKLVFNNNNIHSLYQIDALSVMNNIKHLDIGIANKTNVIDYSDYNNENQSIRLKKTKNHVKFNASNQIINDLFRLYCIFRLPNIDTIDGVTILNSERNQANQKFAHLKNQWKNENILAIRGFCAPMLNKISRTRSQILNSKNKNALIFDIFESMSNDNKIDQIEDKIDDKIDDNQEKMIGLAKKSIDDALNAFELQNKIKRLFPTVICQCIVQTISDLNNV